MIHIEGFQCTLCNREYEAGERLFTCPSCGEKGILEIKFDYSQIKKVMNRSYFERNKDYSMFRYSPLISVDTTDSSRYLKVGWTPLYKANRIGRHTGLSDLYFKDDGINPTASLKDRASAVAVAGAIETGNEIIACSSTGNAASSLAGNAARMGLKTVIFVPERAPEGKLAQLLLFGARVIVVRGDYSDAFDLSKKAIEKWGWYNRNAAINPHLVEGKKTVALEIAEQMNWKVPDWVAVSVGDGCTVAGVYKGFYDLLQLGITDRIPRILGVQSDGCSPFVTAAVNKEPLKIAEENTIADSISVGIPRNPVKALNAVEKSNGQWVAVSDQHILKVMALLGSEEGIFAEPAGATGYAGVEAAIEMGIIKPGESVCAIVTGNGLKDVKNVMKASGKPMFMEPDIKELEKYMDV
ncbi:MAG: threonine synthase [Clostridia bacterium]|nr:threonine synthase [Clostridia bacterium]